MRWDRNSLALRLVQVLALVPWNLAKWKASRAMILHHQSSPILLPLLLLHLPHLNLLFKRNVRQRNQIKKEKKRKRKTARRRKQKLIKKRKQKQIKKRMLKTQRKRNQAVEVPNTPPLPTESDFPLPPASIPPPPPKGMLFPVFSFFSSFLPLFFT